jgi:PAS domain S-box-containing protein
MSLPDDPLQRALDEVERLKRENSRLAELLDMAQEFGRLGAWERDPKTLEGRWDDHVFRFFGFAPGSTPHFAEAAARVHPDDRLDSYFRDSLAHPGSYSQRYRIQRPDGTTAHMHSQWRVIAGADGRPERVIGVMLDDTEARELALRAQTERMQLGMALSLSGIGLWRYDIDRQRIFHDQQVLNLLGRHFEPNGVPLQEVRGWIHPDDVAEVREALERTLAEGGPIDTQTRYRHAKGHWVTMQTRRVLERDASGRPMAVVGVGMDVSEQQRRTQQALQLARRLDAAAEAANVGLWSSPLDGRAPEWNAQMFRLLGLDPSRGAMRLGDSLRQLAHVEDRDRVATQALAWMRGSGDSELELTTRIVRSDGSLRWIEVRSRREPDADGAERAFGVMLDVTAQREALERLREANERITLALDAAEMGTWAHDVTLAQDDWDARMFRLRGLDPAAQVPAEQERLALVLPEDHAALQAASLPFIESAEPLAYEFRIRRADDGRVRTLASRSIALTDAQGRVTRRIGVNWDVTDARNIERVQRERELALRESRTQQALFARVSHELRTPLNAVLGFTQLLQAGGEQMSAEQRRERLAQIRGAGETLLATVNDVLALGANTGEAVTVERVVLAAAVEQALAPLAATAAAHGVRLERGLLEGAASADPRRLQQVLTQLLGNAIKFTRRDGRVRIEARLEGREAVVAIDDEGPGIEPARVERLFDPRWGAAGHPGLGLAIAQALAQRMGGAIELAASSASGSRFELRLARADAPGPDGSAAPTVLYIEDNDVNMLIVRELLAQRPHLAFHGAPDGESGLQRALALRPALVLIDMQLPGIDGMEVMRRLRADPATAGSTCIALSANAMPEDRQRALAAGFDAYWTKPIDLTAFLKELDRRLPKA